MRLHRGRRGRGEGSQVPLVLFGAGNPKQGHQEDRFSACKALLPTVQYDLVADLKENELYISAAFDENPLTTINGTAKVVSLETFQKRYPTGQVKKSSKDYGKIFVCRRGCNTRTTTYTPEFKWEDVYQGPDDIPKLVELVETQTKATRKRGPKRLHRDLDDFVINGSDEDETAPRTPKKRRRLNDATTPKSTRKVAQKFLTPTHKRIVVKKPLEFTPLGTRILSPSALSSPFQQARNQLHVSSVPAALPCREEEFSTVYSHLEAAITDGSGSCIYISGTPGTGKTATVREVVAQLHASVQAEELDDFIFVEINGMKVTDPHQSYSLLWQALRGDRVSPSHALELLEREFSTPSPRRVPCVVLMDELDQLVTKNQSVMYNFFNWPGLRHSRLIVLAVANTMDLPERTLSNKISSRLGKYMVWNPSTAPLKCCARLVAVSARPFNLPQSKHLHIWHRVPCRGRPYFCCTCSSGILRTLFWARLTRVPGLTRITFPGYTHEQLMLIIQSRLEGVPGNIVHPDAVQFAARKVAAVSGDARRALDICRRAVEIAESKALAREAEGEDGPDGDGHPTTPSRTGRSKSSKLARGPGGPNGADDRLQQRPETESRKTVVTIATIKRAINEATSSPLQQALRALPLGSKVFLAALLARIRRTGIGEAVLGDIVDEVKKLGLMSQLQPVHDYLLAGPAADNDDKASETDHRRANAGESKTARALGLRAAAIELSEAGIVGMEARHGERVGRVRLGVADDEIRLALGDDHQVKGLGLGS